MASNTVHLQWLFSFDADDVLMNKPEIFDFCYSVGGIIGVDKNKTSIQSINSDFKLVSNFPWKLLVVIFDDLVCVKKNWNDILIDNSIRCPAMAYWYPDGRQLRLSTWPVMSREIYDRMGYVYNPSFKRYYFDNYYHDLLVRQNSLFFINQKIISLKKDKQNIVENNKLYKKDRDLYLRLTRAK